MLAALKRRGLIPTSLSTFTTADFYDIVDEETQTYIVPLLMSVREEYLVAYEDIAVTAGTTEYRIPERAIASRLRDVALAVDGTSTYHPLSRLEPENIDSFSDANRLAGPGGYYLRNNQIVLSATTTGTLRVSYYQRPNRVVATSAVGEITLINTGTNTVTVSGTCPSTFTTAVTYDFVRGKPGFDTLSRDVSASVVGASTVTTSALPTGLAVGDFICLAQETPIVQIPVELHPLLAQRAAATVLSALGNTKAEKAFEVADKMEARLLKLLTPRTDGSNRYVVNKYGVGRGRSSHNRRW